MDQDYAKYLLKKTQKDYDFLADEFSASRAFSWSEMENLAEKYVKRGDRVLDAGCGNGRLFGLLKDKEIFYEGIDFSKKLVEFARDKHGDHFFVKNLLDLTDYPNNSFNVIFCVAALQHIPSDFFRKKVIEEFARILVKGGYLLMTNWNMLHQEKYKPYMRKYKLKRFFGGSQLDKGDVLFPWKARKGTVLRYYHAFSEEEIEDLLHGTKFKLIENYYVKKGGRVDKKSGFNLVTVAKCY